MPIDPKSILSVLDGCCDSFTFPMLDNGYRYLASTRLSLLRSEVDWAMVIEVFGFSPRAGLPDTSTYTFASRLHDRERPEDYVSRQAYERYLADNPSNEFRSHFPIREGPWLDAEASEFVADGASEVLVRDRAIPLPGVGEYAGHGIALEEPPRVQVFELCRLLAGIAREQVLTTPAELRASVLPAMGQLLQLDVWHHPNVVDEERPSGSETFRQLAEVLATGDVSLYRPSKPPNTHWRHWPEGGRL